MCRKFGQDLAIGPSLPISWDLPVISALRAAESRLTNRRRTTVVCRPRNCAFRLTSAPPGIQVTGLPNGPARQAADTVKIAKETALVVNCATRWIGLILMTTLLAHSVAGQDLPLPDPDGLELPFDSSMPSEFEGVPLPDVENLPQPTENEAPSRLVTPSQSRQMPARSPAPTSGGQGSSGYLTNSFADGMGAPQVDEFESYAWDGQPAPVVSSGTWLDRGVWYAEADALVLYLSLIHI